MFDILLVFFVVTLTILTILRRKNIIALRRRCRRYVIDYFKEEPRQPIDLELLEKEKLLRPFPFRFFKDENGKTIPIVAVTGFFRNNRDKERYYTFLNAGIKVIGITAYRSFPKPIENDPSEDTFHLKDDFNYLKNIRVWLYCMKDYKAYGFSETEHHLLNMSESDFYDVEDKIPSQDEKKYDFIYICNKDSDHCPTTGWNSIVRNYNLALKCFPIMFNNLNLKGLIVGRVGCGLEDIYPNNVQVTDFLDYYDLQQKIRESRFLFIPNLLDASPRVISEALIKNVPVLMFKDILCGFKYINNETGIFFQDEKDIELSIKILFSKIHNIQPRKWWLENHSHKINSAKLHSFLNTIYPDILKNIKEVSLVV